MKVTVKHNQSVIDLAVQYTGTAENAFKIAHANNISVDAYLAPGSVLEIPKTVNISTEIRDYFKNKNQNPATHDEVINENEIILEGISYWIINENFVVQ